MIKPYISIIIAFLVVAFGLYYYTSLKGDNRAPANIPDISISNISTSSSPITGQTSTSTTSKKPVDKPLPIGSIPPGSKNFTLSFGQKGTFGDLSFVPTSILEDSRCPIDVQCIQAGRVVVAVTLTLGSQSKQISLQDNSTEYVFGAYTLKLVSVEPVKKSTVAIMKTDYQLHFVVIKK